MTPEEKADLERKAQSAQREPLHVSNGTTIGARVPVVDAHGTIHATFKERAAAEWFVAANPAAVLSLLAENAAQAEEIARLRDAMEMAGHMLGTGMPIAAETLLLRVLAKPSPETSAPPRPR